MKKFNFKKLCVIGIAALAAICFCGIAAAEEPLETLPLTPVPELKIAPPPSLPPAPKKSAAEDQTGGLISPQAGMPVFDGMGRLSRLENDEIVIDDSMANLMPDAKFRSQKNGGRTISRSDFKVGSMIGYYVAIIDSSEKSNNLAGEGKYPKISELWLLK